MMVYAAFDDDQETTQVASNHGWALFCRWVSSLPVGQCLDLRHLCRYGWDQNLSRLRNQLMSAQRFYRPSDDVLSVGKVLIGMLSNIDGHNRITVIS